MVAALAATVFYGLEAGRLTVDVHALKQLRFGCFVQATQYAYRVLPFHAEAWVHQLIRQLARVGQQQQAFGVQVKPTDRLPLALLQAGQASEHGRAVLRIVVRDNFARRLVICNDSRRRRHDANAHRFAVHFDLVAKRDALAGVSWLSVYGDLAVSDPLLHVAA